MLRILLDISTENKSHHCMSFSRHSALVTTGLLGLDSLTTVVTNMDMEDAAPSGHLLILFHVLGWGVARRMAWAAHHGLMFT